MDHHQRAARLGALALAAGLLFSFPLLAVFDTGRLIAGIPAVALYVFGSWAIIIAMTAWVGRQR